MSTFNIERQDIGGGNLSPDREQLVTHIVAGGTLAAAALRYAQVYADGSPHAVEHYTEWLSHPEKWDDYGVACRD